MLVGRKIVVDDVGDVMNIKTTSRNAGGNENGSLARAESTNGVLALSLGAITVDASARDLAVEQVIINLICSTLRVNKDDSTSRRSRHEQVENGLLLHGGLDIDDFLLDVLVRTTSTTNTNANVIMSEMLSGEVASNLGEGSGKHHVGDVALILIYAASVGVEERRGRRRTTALHDLLQLSFPVGLEHLISFVNDHVLEALQGEKVRSVNEVAKTTGCSNENIAALLKLDDLLGDWTTAVDDAGTKHGSIAETTSLIEDLGGKLTSWADDQDQGLSLDWWSHPLYEESRV